MATAIALFTRDLRVHDNPVLAAAARAEFTVPLFVMDADISALGFAGRPRAGFLGGCVADLDGALGGLGAGLVMRRALVVHEGVHTVVAPGAVTPAGSDHFAMFTPYWRRWSDTPMRALVAPPRRLRLPRLAEQTIRVPAEADAGALLPGGESAARARAKVWLARGLERYADRHDTPGVDGTSRLSPYLHFGCISAAELVGRVRRLGRSSAAADAFVRQLAWRDFYAQLLAAPPMPRTRTIDVESKPGETTLRHSLRGKPARPAIRSSTPACGSSPPKDGCTTGPG